MRKILKYNVSVSALGAEGREFESLCPDYYSMTYQNQSAYKYNNTFLLKQKICKKYDYC